LPNPTSKKRKATPHQVTKPVFLASSACTVSKLDTK
jgi:hypothetical protein